MKTPWSFVGMENNTGLCQSNSGIERRFQNRRQILQNLHCCMLGEILCCTHCILGSVFAPCDQMEDKVNLLWILLEYSVFGAWILLEFYVQKPAQTMKWHRHQKHDKWLRDITGKVLPCTSNLFNKLLWLIYCIVEQFFLILKWDIIIIFIPSH